MSLSVGVRSQTCQYPRFQICRADRGDPGPEKLIGTRLISETEMANGSSHYFNEKWKRHGSIWLERHLGKTRFGNQEDGNTVRSDSSPCHSRSGLLTAAETDTNGPLSCMGVGPWRSQVTKEGPGRSCLSPLAQTVGIKMFAFHWLWFKCVHPSSVEI